MISDLSHNFDDSNEITEDAFELLVSTSKSW